MKGMSTLDTILDTVPPAATPHAQSPQPRSIVMLGLSITSSWGNGHATTFRALIKALHARGHRVTFLERDVPWYATNRDFTEAPYCDIILYRDLADLQQNYTNLVRTADVVIVGSYVPEGVAVGEWATRTAEGVTAFYDIDTPVTLAKLSRNDTEYLSPALIPAYDCYLSFTGGPTLTLLEEEYGAQRARPLYCSVDPDLYYPESLAAQWQLGYMGTYSTDRQPGVDELLIQPARLEPQQQFVVAGPNYPADIAWPTNVERIDHLPPQNHRTFYNSQRFTLNITRDDMKAAGYAPSVRLFEAAACGTPIISDYWPGLETLFVFDEEILIAHDRHDVHRHLTQLSDEERQAIGNRARGKVCAHHTATQRALELESYIDECIYETA